MACKRSRCTIVQSSDSKTSHPDKIAAQRIFQSFSECILIPDQNGKIARALKHASTREISNCFAAIKDNLVALSRHPLANYAMQMLFKVASEEILAATLPVLFDPQSLIESCTHENANFVIQTYLEVAPTPLCLDAVQRIFSSSDSLIFIGNNRVGNNTIQAALRACPKMHSEGRRLYDCLANPFVLKSLARHKHGMHCIRCLLEVQSPPSEKLRSAFWDSWLELSNNCFANLCVSAFLIACPPEDMAKHVNVLAEHILNLSTHNYANHVVQTWIYQIDKLSKKADSFMKGSVDTIIGGIQGSLFELAMDKHGAFVVCTALRAYKQNQKCALLVDALCRGSCILHIARTQYGCQLLQKWSEIASKEQLMMISAALSRNFAAASRDKFGNHFVLKMITYVSPVVIFNDNAKIDTDDIVETNAGENESTIEHTPLAHDSEGLRQLCYNIAELSEHQHASHVVQLVFKVSVWWQLTIGTQIKITEALCANLSRLCHHKLGVHVARKAFHTIFDATKAGIHERRPQELLLSALKENFRSIAKDQHGCRMIAAAMGCHHDDLTEVCVLQACASVQSLYRATFGAVTVKTIIIDCYYSRDGGTKSMLHKICNAMSAYAVAMAKDRHGNLVIQAALRHAATWNVKKDKKLDNVPILNCMNDTNKQGSKIRAHKPVQHGDYTLEPCRELILSLKSHIIPLSLDWFGNRVVQTLIECLPRISRELDLYHSIRKDLMLQKSKLESNKYAIFVLRKLNEVEEARERARQVRQHQEEEENFHTHITFPLGCGSFPAIIGGKLGYSPSITSAEIRQHPKAHDNNPLQALPSQSRHDKSAGVKIIDIVSMESTYYAGPDYVVAQSESNSVQERIWSKISEPYVYHRPSRMATFRENTSHSHMPSKSAQSYSLSAPAWNSETFMASPDKFVHPFKEQNV